MKKYITPNAYVVSLAKEDIMTLSATEASAGTMSISWNSLFTSTASIDDDGMGIE